MSITTRRIPELDIARAIAVIAIIVYHTGMVFSEPLYPGAGMPEWLPKFLDTFHLYTLFIVSGYLTNFNRPLSGSLVAKAARSALLPYAISCLFIIGGSAMWACALGTDPAEQAQRWFEAALWGAGAQHPLALVPDLERIGGIWFLPALFWAKLYIGATAKLGDKGKLVAMLAALAFGMVSANYVWLPLSIQSGIAGAAFMYVGWLFRTHADALAAHRIPVTVVSAGLWIAAIAYGGNSSIAMCAFPAGIIDIAGGIGASWCILRVSALIARHAHGLSRALECAGRNTLPLFALHIVEDNTLPMWIILPTLITSCGAHPWSWVALACARLLFDAMLVGLMYVTPLLRTVFFPHIRVRLRERAATFWSSLYAASE